MKMLLKIIINAFLLFVVAYVVPGIDIDSFFTAIVVLLILSVVNIFIKPLLHFLTLPINILTLGIVGLVINILLFMGVAAVVPGFEISNFITATIGLFLYSLLQGVVNLID